MIPVGNHRIPVFLLVTSVLICSCAKEQIVPSEDGMVPLNISGGICQTQTRASANGFEAGDAVGLYAVNYLEGNVTPGALSAEGNQADNVKYTLDESGKWSPVRPAYYRDINTHVDLYCYYPYQRTPSDINSANFEVSRDQSTLRSGATPGGYESSDLLWGKVTDVSPTEKSVPVLLNHIMSCVIVELSEGSGFGEGEFGAIDKTVLVTNTTRKSTVNYATGVVAPVGGAQSDGIVASSQSDGTFRAIVVPQQVAASTALFSITLSGENYVFTSSEAVTFVSGKILRFSIKINRKDDGGGYELSYGGFSVQQWYQDNVVHIGEARQYYCVTVDTPGTLGRLIKQAGKNPDKIRNIKVSGNITAADFYFMRDSMAILEAVNLREAKVKQVHVDRKLNEDGKTIDGIDTYKDNVIPSEAFYNKTSLYYFVFPDDIEIIEHDAFSNTRLCGALVLSDNVEEIHYSAFSNTLITSVSFPLALRFLDSSAFYQCNYLSCQLLFPERMTYIGDLAFYRCSLSGHLILPENLAYLGGSAFCEGGSFSSGLDIPEKITTIGNHTFCDTKFSGPLNLNNAIGFGAFAFRNCGFTGELILPEGTISTGPEDTFIGNNFSSIVLPESLVRIDRGAFANNPRLYGTIKFPENCVVIGEDAFKWCPMITGLSFSSGLQSIQANAFDGSIQIFDITCTSEEPPTLHPSAFSSIIKDNFTVQVPEKSIVKYRTDPQWGQFHRISAYYKFSIDRPKARFLNNEETSVITLHAPNLMKWHAENIPDWIFVTPTNGTGTADITIKVEKNTGPWHQIYDSLSDDYVEGRDAVIDFCLDDKDVHSTLTVEQYQSEHYDGEVIRHLSATKGKGVDIVLLGDGYDAREIAGGKYLGDISEAITHYFDVEPYKTYKDYFNVYSVIGVSEESGISSAVNVLNNKFKSVFRKRIALESAETSFEYAAKAPIEDLSRTVIIQVCNTPVYDGVAYMYGDGAAIAICPKSKEGFPFDFRGIVQHEAGGHGFGKLADEYIYHAAFIQACGCICCSHEDALMSGKSLGWYRNLELTGSQSEVGWSHLIFNPKYSDIVDVFEGGYFHTRGVFRSEVTSCMNNNIPYFSTISRQAIVERIMEYAGEEFTLEKFYENDKISTGASTKSGGKDPRYETYPSNGRHNPPVYAGDRHPEINTH